MVEENGHETWVGFYARGILEQLGLMSALGRTVEQAVRLHDIGEQFLPPELLLKPARLTNQELRVVQRHATIGEQLVLQNIPDPRDIAAIVRYHHERIDGRGYPDGLWGRQIPLGARVIAVADTFDALTSDRPHRGAKSWVEALDELEYEAGAQLDPVFVAALRTWLEAYAHSLLLRVERR